MSVQSASVSRLALLGCLVALFTGCGSSDGTSPPAPEPDRAEPEPRAPEEADTPPPVAALPADRAVAVGVAMNRLAYTLFPRVAAGPGNVVFSPASAHAALAMVTTGAHAETRDQLTRVLGVGGAEGTALLRDVGRTLRAWNDESRTAFTLRVANRVFADHRLPFENQFVTGMLDDFGAPVDGLDFTDPEAARDTINQWVSERTREHIPTLLTSPDVTRDTRMVLVSAAYLAAAWEHPFDTRLTQPADFHVAGGPARAVPTMSQLGSFPVASVDRATVVELPLAGRELVMRLVLPDEGVAPESLADAAHLGPLNTLTETLATLLLPKFRLASPGMALGDELRALGVSAAFDPATADFSGIAPLTADRLYMENVVQKAFLAVDERGAEGSAATAVVMGRMGAPRELRFDRPFLCAIRDVRSGALLFLARVSDPAPNR